MVAYTWRRPVDKGWNEKSASLRLFQIEQNNMTAKSIAEQWYTLKVKVAIKESTFDNFPCLQNWVKIFVILFFRLWLHFFAIRGCLLRKCIKQISLRLSRWIFGDQSWPIYCNYFLKAMTIGHWPKAFRFWSFCVKKLWHLARLRMNKNFVITICFVRKFDI